MAWRAAAPRLWPEAGRGRVGARS